MNMECRLTLRTHRNGLVILANSQLPYRFNINRHQNIIDDQGIETLINAILARRFVETHPTGEQLDRFRAVACLIIHTMSCRVRDAIWCFHRYLWITPSLLTLYR